jgi:chromosome segregation ATPase
MSSSTINRQDLKPFTGNYAPLKDNQMAIGGHVAELKKRFTPNSTTYSSANNMNSALTTLLERAEVCDDKVRSMLEDIVTIKKDITNLQTKFISKASDIKSELEELKTQMLAPDPKPTSKPIIGSERKLTFNNKIDRGPLPSTPPQKKSSLEERKTIEAKGKEEKVKKLKELENQFTALRYHDFASPKEIQALKEKLTKLEKLMDIKYNM